MTGANGKFRPNDKITAAEVCTTIARQRGLSGSGALPAGVRAGEWYSEAVSAVYANGLLEGLNDFRPTAAMTREDAMQLFANLLQADGTAAMSDTETAQTLASVKDADTIRGGPPKCGCAVYAEGSGAGLQRRHDQTAGYVHSRGVRKAADDDLKIRERPMKLGSSVFLLLCCPDNRRGCMLMTVLHRCNSKAVILPSCKHFANYFTGIVVSPMVTDAISSSGRMVSNVPWRVQTVLPSCTSMLLPLPGTSITVPSLLIDKQFCRKCVPCIAVAGGFLTAFGILKRCFAINRVDKVIADRREQDFIDRCGFATYLNRLTGRPVQPRCYRPPA